MEGNQQKFKKYSCCSDENEKAGAYQVQLARIIRQNKKFASIIRDEESVGYIKDMLTVP